MASAKNSPKVEKASADKKAKSKPDHPKYMDMIREAIVELKDRTGSSRHAIKKYILSKYNLVETVAVKQINLALKRGLEQKILYCPQGHSNSYKLFKQETPKPKPKKPVAKKVAEIKDKKKSSAKKAKSTTKKSDSKKASSKKASSKSKTTTKKATTKAASTKKAASKKADTKKASTTKKTIKKPASKSASTKKAKTTKSKSK